MLLFDKFPTVCPPAGATVTVKLTDALGVRERGP